MMFEPGSVFASVFAGDAFEPGDIIVIGLGVLVVYSFFYAIIHTIIYPVINAKKGRVKKLKNPIEALIITFVIVLLTFPFFVFVVDLFTYGEAIPSDHNPFLELNNLIRGGIISTCAGLYYAWTQFIRYLFL